MKVVSQAVDAGNSARLSFLATAFWERLLVVYEGLIA
jgi:hypothetical protein